MLESISLTSAVPFANVYVTLSKLEHIQLVMDARYWRTQHERAASRQLQQEASYKLSCLKCRSKPSSARRRFVANLAQVKVRDLQQRLFGRKSERSKGASELQRRPDCQPARRGQRRGAPGHGRKMLADLPERIETVGLDRPQCPACGEFLDEFPGTEDSEVLEIEVKAYRRLIRRHRYRPTCHCGCPGS